MSFLASAIRVAREKRHWTQTNLSDRLGVSQGTISFWENGVEIPSLSHQLQLIELMPDMLTALAIQELHLLDRVQSLERAVFKGKCGCEGCGCSEDSGITSISSLANQ